MPANASFSSFLSRSLRPTIIGLNIAFLAALGLGLIELPALLWKGELSSLPGALALLFPGALLYAIIFNLFFFLARVTAALVSHLDRFWPALVPGLVVFLLLGEPSARFLLARFAPGDSSSTILLGALFILAALGLCFLVLHVFPLLRNINSSMMLFAALAARVIAMPLENIFDGDAFASLILFQAILIVLAAGFYAVLQLRFLQHLAPLHDSPRVPDGARTAAWIVAGVMALLLFYVIAFRAKPTPRYDFALYLFSACGLLFALHWSLTAVILNRMGDARDPLPLLRDSEPRWFLAAALTLTLAAAGFAASIFPSTRAARDIAAAGVVSHEVLTFFGFAFDADRDGNSRWPGGDPDDRDPCVRLDFRGNCAGLTAPAFPGTTGLPSGRRGSKSKQARVLLTIAGKNYPAADVQSLLASMGAEPRPMRLFLPGKSPGRALRALFQDLNGLQERAGLTRPSVFSRYAARGIRTLCGGHDAGLGYLSSGNPARLDLGCQVHVPIAAGEKRAELSRTAGAMLKKMRYYRERYNLVWIHHDFGGGREARVRPGDMGDLTKTLGRLPEDVPAVLIFMGAGDGAFARAYVVGVRKNAKEKTKAGVEHSNAPVSLREILNRTDAPWLRLPEHPAVRRVGTGDAKRPAWFSAFARGLGDKRSFYTFAPRADGIHSFDGITGAGW